MTTKYTDFNRPKDWHAFERLTRDLFMRILHNPHVDLFGSSGYAQGGLDIIFRNRDERRIGVQCKGRNDAAFNKHKKVKKQEFVDAISDARQNHPGLNEFVFVTTGPNDPNLKLIAIEESERVVDGKRLKIEFHAWDWFEGHFSESANLGLAIGYGLIAAIRQDSAPVSEVARAIGERFRTALKTISSGSGKDVSVQSLARALGIDDWRQLESIENGTTAAGSTELTDIADKMGVSADWLIDDKGPPFRPKRRGNWDGPVTIGDAIEKITPRRIYFVRKICSDADAIVVLQVDDIRWHIFPQRFPVRGGASASAQSQIFEFLCLVRHLRRVASERTWACRGIHCNAKDFEALLAGDIYPPSLLRNSREDPWWDDFADMSDRSGRLDLQSAIRSAKTILADYRRAAKLSTRHGELLEWASLPVE